MPYNTFHTQGYFKRQVILLFLVSGLLAACVHPPLQPDDQPGPDPIPSDTSTVDTTTIFSQTCDPDTVYFAQDVLPILNSNCAMSGCHDAASAQDGIVLDSYANVMASGEVDAGAPFESDLYEVLIETDPDDVMPPPPDEKLKATQIEIIRKWIAQGALNLSCQEATCDTTNITYDQFVKPLLDTHCTGCHSGQSPGGGILIRNYNDVKALADAGQLYGVIAHQPGYAPMPKGENQLPDCDIASIRTWINDGALEN